MTLQDKISASVGAHTNWAIETSKGRILLKTHDSLMVTCMSYISSYDNRFLTFKGYVI